jgi:hypothetical protein
MQKYYIYSSLGPRQPWRKVKNERGGPKIFLTGEIASLAMADLKRQNPTLDFMFYPHHLGANVEPPETLARNCGCSGRRRG